MAFPVRIRHPKLGIESTQPSSTLRVHEKNGWSVVEAVDNTPDRFTVDDILAEVSDDPARAARALEAELARPEPRKSLVSKLSRIANAEEA